MAGDSKILVEIINRLEKVKSKYYRGEIYSNLLILFSGLSISIAILVIAEAIFELASSGRTIFVLLLLISIFIACVWSVMIPLLRRFNFLRPISEKIFALQIGDFFPQIKDRLLNSLQLAQDIDSASKIYSAEMIDESLKNFHNEIKDIDFTKAIDTSDIPKYHKLLLMILGGIIIIGMSFPVSFSNSAYRLFHFTKDFTPPPKYSIEVQPGNKEILKGENVEINVKVTALTFSIVPKEIKLIRKHEDQENEDEIKLKSDSIGFFKTTFQSLRITTNYFIRLADMESERYKITVLDLPVVKSFSVRLDYPAYSKIQSRVLDEFVGDVTALVGTCVTINGVSSKSLKDAFIQFGDNVKLTFVTRNEKFSTSFSLTKDNTYYVVLVDKENLTNNNPVKYQLKVIADENPSVTIIEPGRNLDIAGGQSLNLRLQAKDDYGFSKMQLGYKLIKSRYERLHADNTYLPIELSVNSNAQIELPYLWNLKPLNLVPEDVVEYFAEVFDNDNVKGPKSSRSNMYLLRLPSLDEVFADVEKEHERSIEDMKQSLEQAKKLKEDLESINRDLKKNKNPDWQMQKKMEEMAKQYQQVQKKLDEVQNRLDQMMQQMQNQNVLSKETMEKYFELQQLFQQLDSAELQKALQQMQQRMPNISKEQLQQAMQKVTFSEEQFRQSIERTINLLKRIQIEQKMDEVKKRAEEIEKLQREILEETEKAKNDSQKQKELAQKQMDLAKKEQAMEREAEDLQRRMEEFFTEMPADKLQKLIEDLKKQKLDEKMQQSAQQMQMGNMQSAQQIQQQISQQMQQFSEQMSAMQQQMLQQQSQYIMNELRKATNSLLELSKEEESLKQQSQNAPPNSPTLRQNAQDQLRVIQDLNNVIKGLMELSQKSFAVTPEMGKAIGEALARMNNAMRALDSRNGYQASQEQGQAMAALNRAAMQVQNAMQQMMQSGSGIGSLMQQLQMMAGQQMSINLQTQQLGGMSQQQAMEAGRLAKEQAAIQKSLEELNREAQQSGDQQKLLGDLQKIADEMKEVVRNLEQNNINPEVIKRQERILSRLLDASKSLRERDYEKKRKAETGTQITRKSPKELDLNSIEGRTQLREELLRALEYGYAKDYQELIKKYFEELEKTEKSLY